MSVTSTTVRKRSRSQRKGSVHIEATVAEVSESKPLVDKACGWWRRRLYHFSELPDWQKDNEKILRGYVRETNSFRECLISLLYFNNETVNMYTHLIPAVLYLCGASYFAYVFLIPIFPSTSFTDYFYINVFLLGAFACLICSSCFHCLKQHSERQCGLWSKLDYMGIICLISCSMIPIMYFGFFDYRWHFLTFTTVTLSLAAFCTLCVLNDKFNTVEFRPFRAAFFTLFGLSGILPLGAGFIQFGIKGVLERIRLKFIGLEGVFYIAGAIIYGYRIPETFAPGKFDFVGSSHQIFHIMVVLGSICHLKAVVDSYVLMHTNLLRV